MVTSVKILGVHLLLFAVSSLASGRELINPPECGTIPKMGRMIGGVHAPIGSNPWIALLMFEGQDIETSRIGALINHRYVVTTASALKHTIDYVRLGEQNPATDPDCEGMLCADKVRDYKVEKNIKHADYDHKTLENDIALLRLNQEVVFTEWVYPICLCGRFLPRTLTIAGWAKTTFGNEKRFELKQTEVHAILPSKCAYITNITEPHYLCTKADFDTYYHQRDIGSPFIRQEGSGPKKHFCVASLLQMENFKRNNPSRVLSCSYDWLKKNMVE